ncbi:MAG TPA: GNAT family N-acetyltransferase [Phycisphaerae bacterium]|nr:GNAT family N-acetyltransferase [Phycisphaerae bacterium]
MLRIEPVRPGDRDRAVSVLLGRAVPPRQVHALLDALCGPRGAEYMFWCARGLRGIRAAAMGHLGPGRIATVFHSRPRRDRDVRVLSELLSRMTEAIFEADCVYVQSLVPPSQRLAAEVCAGAGYAYLAQLIYLRLPVRPAPTVPADALDWKTVDGTGDELLKRVIAETYVDSMDCPGLVGLRSMDDVLAGHRASGVYTPAGWLLPHKGGECVGCILVNDAGERSAGTDVVYLGVRPPWRRQGLARAMLARAVAYAASRRKSSIALAVDAANTPAVNLYRSAGFTETDRRDVWAKCRLRDGQPGRDLRGGEGGSWTNCA